VAASVAAHAALLGVGWFAATSGPLRGAEPPVLLWRIDEAALEAAWDVSPAAPSPEPAIDPVADESPRVLAPTPRDEPVADDLAMEPPPPETYGAALPAPDPRAVARRAGVRAVPARPEAALPPALPTPPVVAVRAPSTPTPVARLVVSDPVPHATNAKPPYPARALRDGRTGTVRLLLRLDEAGRVRGVTLLEGSGHPDLDAAAVGAAWAWRFVPATVGGTPSAAEVVQAVRFVIEG
jgi:TonB family protein